MTDLTKLVHQLGTSLQCINEQLMWIHKELEALVTVHQEMLADQKSSMDRGLETLKKYLEEA